ncbi:MAG TPA: ATP-binding protein [Candidatus Kapabacteria bacterium]|nr:ATP-binding protein [Candidatus Kapabacteria bacterium]
MFTTLRSKILAGFAAVIAINVAFSLWAIYQFSLVGGPATEAIADSYEFAGNIGQLGTLIDGQIGLLQQMGVTVTPDPIITQFEARTTDVRSLLAKLGTSPVMAGRQGGVDTIRAEYERFLSAATIYRNRLLGRERGDPRGVLLSDVQPLATSVRAHCFNLLLLNQNDISDLRSNLRRELRQTLVLVAIATLVGTLFGVVGGGVYSKWAIRPIKRLTQAVKNLSGGRLGEQILITTADELGDLSFEFNRMIERLGRYEAMNIEQLLLEKRKVETIVQSIATPITVVDSSMRLLLINSAALSMFRLPLEGTYIGHEAAEFIHDEGVLETLAAAVDQPHGGEAPAPHVYVVHEEGAERFYSVSALPLETTSAVSGVVAVFSDITHFKELDRLKSEFLAKVSHEFRTPLSSIIMSLDILREGIVGEINAEQLDLLNASKDDCRRLSKLISDLLELSRMEARMRDRSVVLIDIAALIDSVLRPHRLPAREKNVELAEQVEPGLPALWAEPEEIRWLFNNLVSNALRHTDAGGRVTVSVGVEHEELTVTVEDTGHGIPLDSLHRIFDKFHQVGSPSVPTPGSVGLGLAIAKDVVESYGGRITVTSEIHKGSCFTVRIPMANLAPPGEAAAP